MPTPTGARGSDYRGHDPSAPGKGGSKGRDSGISIGNVLGALAGLAFGGPMGAVGGWGAGGRIGDFLGGAQFSGGRPSGPRGPGGQRGQRGGGPNERDQFVNAVMGGRQHRPRREERKLKGIIKEPPLTFMPGVLPFGPEATNLQQRTGIATGGTAGLAGYYNDPEVMKYYQNLLMRDMIGDDGQYGAYESVMPVEHQYLQQAFGLQYDPNIAALLKALQGYQFA